MTLYESAQCPATLAAFMCDVVTDQLHLDCDDCPKARCCKKGHNGFMDLATEFFKKGDLNKSSMECFIEDETGAEYVQLDGIFKYKETAFEPWMRSILSYTNNQDSLNNFHRIIDQKQKDAEDEILKKISDYRKEVV